VSNIFEENRVEERYVEGVVGLVVCVLCAVFAEFFPDFGAAGPILQVVEVFGVIALAVTHRLSNELEPYHIKVPVS